jgi:putative peptidoglycan binding protein
MRVHVVKQGECLSSIAHAHGFGSYKAIYEHADNAEFRKKRPDPAVILPGDEITIPDVKPKTIVLATGQRHQIVVRRPVVQLRVRLRDRDGSPVADQDYVLRHEGGESKGRTTSDGILEETVPASIEGARVEFGASGLTLQLRCGTVDPVETISGAQVRLNNLGFGAGAVDGILGSRTRDAVRRFQEANHLAASGELDDQTCRKLVEAYGC